MAEAWTRHLAAEQGLRIVAESAGTLGGGSLNPVAVAVMEEAGVPMASQVPKALDQPMVDRADRIISMGCGVDAAACPAKFLLTEDWGLDDPAGQPVEAVRVIRDQIKERVVAMLAGIS